MRSLTPARILAGAWLIAGAVLAPEPGRAQPLAGRVVDRDGMGLESVRVRLVPAAGPGPGVAPFGSRITDDRGRFAFRDVPDGDYRLLADAPGWADWASGPLRLRSDDTVRVRVTLRESPLPLDGLEIIASRRPWWEVLEPVGLWAFYDRMVRYGREGRGRFFSRADVAPWRGVPVARALGAAVPSLRAEQDPRRPGQYLLRGPGGCHPIVFVDGAAAPLSMVGAGGRVVDEIPLDMLVDPYSLVAVEIYRGMSQAPVELSAPRSDADLRCTVVGLWTRRR